MSEYYVPDEPIHFKHVGKVTDKPKTVKYYVPDEPIHFKHVGKIKPNKQSFKEFIMESKDLHISTWLNVHENGHIADASHKVSKELEKYHPYSSDAEYKEVRGYTKDSKALNSRLLTSHEFNEELPKLYHKSVEHLDNVTSKPIGKDVHLYSGIGFNPKEHFKKSEDGHYHLHLPAYTSATTSKMTAHNFASSGHILHIHAKETDKGHHAGSRSINSLEQETILPRNTKLKIHNKPDIYHTDSGKKVHVWHAEIE